MPKMQHLLDVSPLKHGPMLSAWQTGSCRGVLRALQDAFYLVQAVFWVCGTLEMRFSCATFLLVRRALRCVCVHWVTLPCTGFRVSPAQERASLEQKAGHFDSGEAISAGLRRRLDPFRDYPCKALPGRPRTPHP